MRVWVWVWDGMYKTKGKKKVCRLHSDGWAMILEERSACLISFLFDRLILHFSMLFAGFEVLCTFDGSERAFSDVELCACKVYIM
jgi:hypothetical protein